MKDKEAIRQLCKYIGVHARLVSTQDPKRHVYPCEYCPIPKYRNAKKRHKCPAANMKHACSTELMNYFMKDVVK